MKVKVIKASLLSYWYKERIGEIFDVEDYDEEKCLISDSDGHFILRSDCVRVYDDLIALELEIRETTDKLDNLKASLEELNAIKLEDIKAGAKFKFLGGCRRKIMLLQCHNNYNDRGGDPLYIKSGLHNNFNLLHCDRPESATEILEQLNEFGAIKLKD